MLKGKEVISVSDFNKGLNTKANILANEKGQSPNCMNVKWNFDGSIQKRLGSSTQNTIQIGSTTLAGWALDSQSSLTTNLVNYWKLDEASGTRFNQIGSIDLTDKNSNVSSASGIRGNAANYLTVDSSVLYANHNSSLSIGTGNFSISGWVYIDSLDVAKVYFSKLNASAAKEFQVFSQLSSGIERFGMDISTGGAVANAILYAQSLGNINTSTWYNIVAWHSNNSHIGISINLSVNTMSYTFGTSSLNVNFHVGAQGTGGQILNQLGRIDEVGIWNKVLTANERADLYANGSGNTYTGSGQSGFGWAMYDFGASEIRWLTVAAGTGIYASSNLGVTFLNVATSRTQNYQYFSRSKNVLIATAESYDVPLYWSGSAGTFFATLAPNSAPKAKYSANHLGFLFLFNYQDSNNTVKKRSVAYNDENTQLTSAWANNFELPSSADDEGTCAFVVNRILYLSTRYRIFRLSYVGGNPDWSYEPIKEWGFVPRTIAKATLKGSEAIMGMDWSRRMRIFDGSEDIIISDNVESDNSMSDFAMSKVSYAGSGLIVSNAVFDSQEQEYRLCLAIGADSQQTTNSIILNTRTLGMYPYDNQGYQAMCMAESASRLFLMAVDRSGRVHVLNTGNQDVATSINEVYDSPFMFKSTPGSVQKSDKMDLFFATSSAGNLYFYDRVDFSSLWGNSKKTITLNENKSINHIVESIDIPSTHNVYQYRLTSSSGTAEPWKLTHADYYFKSLGIGRGN